ncbi:MAG: 2-dehydropantoate 2-reductase [Anaerolineaceae bacterium]|nr:2-dehydropantoate 2-reductase [Anaerolineaceae bacterium]
MTAKYRVVIQGAGAMGAAYASKFFEHDPDSIAFIASGDRYERLRNDGLIINKKQVFIPVYSPEDKPASPDLIIVALKHQHLKGALPDLQNLVGPNTTILSVMNGLDSEKIIGEVYGMEKMVFAISVGIDAQRFNNYIRFDHIGTIFFGEKTNQILSSRVLHLQSIFTTAGIPFKTPEDMVRIMWWKFMINVGTNQPSAILSAPYGVFQTSEHAQHIMEAAMNEVITIAQAAKVNLVKKDIQDWYTFLLSLNPKGKTSMLQDIEAGRETEVEIFAGKMIELGKTYQIETPVNEILYHAIKVLQQSSNTRK